MIKLNCIKECSEVRFASFFSGGFISAIEVNPPERKLANMSLPNKFNRQIYQYFLFTFWWIKLYYKESTLKILNVQILGWNFTKPVRGRDFTVCRLYHTHVPREQTAGTTWHQNLVTLNLRSKKEKKGTFLTSFFPKSNEIEIFDKNDNSIKQLNSIASLYCNQLISSSQRDLRQEMPCPYCRFMTISSNFFDNYHNIIHKLKFRRSFWGPEQV